MQHIATFLCVALILASEYKKTKCKYLYVLCWFRVSVGTSLKKLQQCVRGWQDVTVFAHSFIKHVCNVWTMMKIQFVSEHILACHFHEKITFSLQLFQTFHVADLVYFLVYFLWHCECYISALPLLLVSDTMKLNPREALLYVSICCFYKAS